MSMVKLSIVSYCIMSNPGSIRFNNTNSSKFLDFPSIFGATWFLRLVTTSRPPENRTWTRKWTQNHGNLGESWFYVPRATRIGYDPHRWHRKFYHRNSPSQKSSLAKKYFFGFLDKKSPLFQVARPTDDSETQYFRLSRLIFCTTVRAMNYFMRVQSDHVRYREQIGFQVPTRSKNPNFVHFSTDLVAGHYDKPRSIKNRRNSIDFSRIETLKCDCYRDFACYCRTEPTVSL